MKMPPLMIRNFHFSSNNCLFTCTKIWNGKTCMKYNPNLKSLKSKEKLRKIREESKRRNKKDWRKFKVKVVSHNLNQLASNKRRKKIFLVESARSIANRKNKKGNIKSSHKRLKSKKLKFRMMMTILCDCVYEILLLIVLRLNFNNKNFGS